MRMSIDGKAPFISYAVHVLVVMFAVSACTHGAGVNSEVSTEAGHRAAIAAASRAFSDAYVRNDMAALGMVYTSDAVLLPPDREVRGREAIMRYFSWGPKFRQIAHRMEPSEVVINGNVAIDSGMWHSTNVRGDAEPSTATGRYLVVWIRESDGEWRMKYDIWHRPVPPAQ